MVPTLGHLGPVAVPTHDVFVGLGVLAALAVFLLELRRRGIRDERMWVLVAGALTGGAIEAAEGMRAGGVRVQVAQVRVLSPLPASELSDLIDSAGQTFVIEQNGQGQLAYLMRGVHW